MEDSVLERIGCEIDLSLEQSPDGQGVPTRDLDGRRLGKVPPI